MSAETIPDVLSAGAIPFRIVTTAEGGVEIRYLIIQHKGGFWGFPKGRKEAFDKDDFANGVRELHEETGLSESDVAFLHDGAGEKLFFDQCYSYQRRGRTLSKRTRLYLAQVTNADVKIVIPVGELIAYRWATLHTMRSTKILRGSEISLVLKVEKIIKENQCK